MKIFNFAYERPLAIFRQQMLTRGISCNIRPAQCELFRPNKGAELALKNQKTGDVPLIDVEYVDDGAFMLFAASPSTLLYHVQQAAAALERTLQEHGMEVNWSPGKTEAMCIFRGNNANAIRAATAANGTKGVEVDGRFFLAFVTKYKHLGSIITANCSLLPEAHHRAALAIAAFAPIATNFFASPAITKHTKVRLAQSLVFSRLLYCTHVWSKFEGAPFRVINNVYMRVLRRICGDVKKGKPQLNDALVRKQLNVPDLENLVRCRRLRYLSRMLRANQSTLHNLLKVTNINQGYTPWLRLVADDLDI
jgi:hypothetical protein